MIIHCFHIVLFKIPFIEIVLVPVLNFLYLEYDQEASMKIYLSNLNYMECDRYIILKTQHDLTGLNFHYQQIIYDIDLFFTVRNEKERPKLRHYYCFQRSII